MTKVVPRIDPEYKSLIRIEHTFNYQDTATPKTQPRHVAHVELTYRNARRPAPTTEVDESFGSAVPWEKPVEDAYDPTHRITDVSDREWEPTLRKLYPQTNADKDYFNKLYGGIDRSGNKLFLVRFYHNESTCTSNVLTHRQGMPGAYDDLRIVIKNTPVIYMLIRGHKIDDDIENVVEQFKSLSLYNPMSVIYTDPSNATMGNSGIKPTAELPKFVAKARYAFETWPEYEQVVGLAALIEQREFMGKHVYQGKVAVVPVPATYNGIHKLYFAYHLQMSVDKHDAAPSLVSGDAVTIDFHPGGNAASANAWKGSITSATDATSMGQLNVIVNRPTEKGTSVPLDTQEYTVLLLEDLKKMRRSSTLRTWSRSNCIIPVTIFTKGKDKECKRLMNNLKYMKPSNKLRADFPAKAEELDQHQEFLMSKDFTQFVGTPLFENIDPQQLVQARPIVTSSLRPYQLSRFQDLENNGLHCKTAPLTGPSGSGKSFLALNIAMPYLLDILVPDSVIEYNRKEKAIMFQQDAEYERKVAAKIAAKAKGIEIAESTEPSASKDTNKREFAPPAPDDKKPETYTTQQGRITFCGIQNDTVEKAYHDMRDVTRRFATDMKLGAKLVIRMYGQESELDAVLAMARPGYNPLAHGLPFNVDPSTKVTGTLPLGLLDSYLAFFRGNGNPGIRDSRMKEVYGSAAVYILELAQFPSFNQSEELLATFTQDELDMHRATLSPIVNAHRDLRDNGDKMSSEIANSVKAAAKLGLRALIAKAAVICTTASVATAPSFNIIRQTHAVFLEEAGRANDAEIAGFFSHFWNASLRMFIGSVNQLGPAAFGQNSNDNPFAKQLILSTLLR